MCERGTQLCSVRLWSILSPALSVAIRLCPFRQRSSFTAVSAWMNYCTTGVGVGTRTILPVQPPAAFLPAHEAAVPLYYRGSPLRLSAYHCSDEKCRSGGRPCPQERGLSEAYFGWTCPNKHSETLQPQLRASPWLTSHPVTPPLAAREKTSEGERRQAARAKACRG